jgi:hypothetical protein
VYNNLVRMIRFTKFLRRHGHSVFWPGTFCLNGANMGRKFGNSFSWKRALGISAAKGRVSRKLGVPLTRSGRAKKLGTWILRLLRLER